MKIVIISDIHDNLVNLKRWLSWCKSNEVEAIICCGDICNSETLCQLADNFNKEIYLVRGNSDIYNEEEIKKFDNVNYQGSIGVFKIKNQTVGVCHEPWLADKILLQERCDIIFCGHTHKPWEEKKQEVKIINPGTLGAVFQKSTFAVWDMNSGEMELKLTDRL